MLTSGCWAVRDTPAVWVWNRSCSERSLARAVAVAHPAGPDATGGPVLGDLLEEVDVRVEEERQARRERVDVESGRAPELDVRESVGERERELLCGRRSGFADVVAGHGDRVPLRHLGRAERDRVAHETQRRTRREDELLLRLVLLEDVVLQRPADRGTRHAGRFRVGDEHREHDRSRAVDRHRRRDLAEIDAAVQVFDVGEGVDGDAALPDFAERERVVRVAAHEGRQVERGRQAVTARREQIVEAAIGVDRGAEPREHPHGPQLRPVHRGVRAARVRVLAGEFAVGRAVHGIDRDARHGREVGVARRCGVEGVLPAFAGCRHAPMIARDPSAGIG